MNISEYINMQKERPLDNIVFNGGLCGIFRKIACIGDSLSSGEFESMINKQKAYHDFYEYSWGQFMARDTGSTVYNFSRGGMTAKAYCENFAEENGFWNTELAAQAYMIALGVNDVSRVLEGELELGCIEDVSLNNCYDNEKTFIGYYAQIVQHYKAIQPKAKFFFITMPNGNEAKNRAELYDKHAELIYQLAEMFENCYVIDLRKYAPVYDEMFKKKYFLGGHMNAAGYRLTALMIESYVDYIIRNNLQDFKQIGFVGTDFYNEDEL